MDEHEQAEDFVVLDNLDLHDDEINRRTVRINGATGLAETDVCRAACMFKSR
jgi:hypothetical protein